MGSDAQNSAVHTGSVQSAKNSCPARMRARSAQSGSGGPAEQPVAQVTGLGPGRGGQPVQHEAHEVALVEVLVALPQGGGQRVGIRVADLAELVEAVVVKRAGRHPPAP